MAVRLRPRGRSVSGYGAGVTRAVEIFEGREFRVEGMKGTWEGLLYIVESICARYELIMAVAWFGIGFKEAHPLLDQKLALKYILGSC